MKIALYVARYHDEKVEPPPSLQYLAGYLIQQKLVDESEIYFANDVADIVAFKPDLVGIGSVSQCIDDAIRVASAVRLQIPECWTVLGGYHISALPEFLPECFDIGVIGEGEITFYEVALLKSNLSLLTAEVLHGINGICYRDFSGSIVTTAPRPLLEQIDALRPFRKPGFGVDWPYLFTARGCPYRCMYCASHAFWKTYRFHSAEYVVAEIKDIIAKFGVTSIYSVDDLFIAPKSRLIRIRDLLKECGLLGTLRFKGFVRVNLIDEETMAILKELGFVEIRFGMETASERLLNYIKDHPFTLAQVEQLIGLAKKYDIPVTASFMFGIPGETEGDIDETKRFLMKHRKDLLISGVYIMQPVPGSRYWDDCVAANPDFARNIDFSLLALDLEHRNFSWDKVLYLNGNNISLQKFRRLMERFYADLVVPRRAPFIQRCFNYLARKTWKRKGIVGLMGKTAREGGKLSGVRLYVGCGSDNRDGFLGCDMRDVPGVSVICNAWEISSYCVNVQEIYSRHMLEHLTMPQLEATFQDWLKALGPGGGITAVVPNIEFHIDQWKRAVWNESNWKEMFSDARHSFAGFWGWQRESAPENLKGHNATAYWDVHKCGFNADFMSFLLNRAGYRNVSCTVVDNVHLVARAIK